MTNKKEKSPTQQQPTEDIPMADNIYLLRGMHMAIIISLMSLISHLCKI